MFFEKPNVRYVDMCIYIDEHSHTEDCDSSKIYEYLFHIISMLTIKRNYFDSSSDIDDFSLYAASRYYMRIYDEKLDKVNSILNFIRKTLHAMRYDYNKTYKYETEKPFGEELISIDMDSFRCFIDNKTDHIGKQEFSLYIEDICSSIRKIATNTPYKNDASMTSSIYISCLLSFLNSITLSNNDLKRLRGFKRPSSLTDKLLEEVYMKERYDATILYHLPDYMHNYITFLTTKVRHQITRELSQSLQTYYPVCITMKNLLMSDIVEQD